MKKILPVIVLLLALSFVPSYAEDGKYLAIAFQSQVDRKLNVPQEAQARYAQLLEAALKNAGTQIAASQYILVLDRNPNVQAIFLYWLDAQAAFNRPYFIGASPASSGMRGEYDHFITPTGVFDHSLDNKDFRAEGTYNGFGIRGYGRRGMRVFDFGWVMAERAWGRGGQSPMRLLMHATDPDRLEKHLGKTNSKGCVRIPATLDNFIDRYGLLDAEYEQALAGEKKLWVLRPDRIPTQWSGRYLVIVDSGSLSRPEWSPAPIPLLKLKPSLKLTPAASAPQPAASMQAEPDC
ncbi:MAG: murein L,D-transpeptidase [Sideroxydans sp.]|nr:murein L,D-transpeptidase [Sideroxydans sp.]